MLFFFSKQSIIKYIYKIYFESNTKLIAIENQLG